MTENVNILDSVLKAFPQLTAATFVRRFASPVPLVPDTNFDIYITQDRQFFALVMTDHADPLAQSQELKEISGQYEFEFDYLLKPDNNSQTIEVLNHNEMVGDFSVYIGKTYFYVAHLVNTN